MSNPFSHWLRKFFQPPIFADDPEKTRVSNALYATIFILFTSNTTIFLVLGNIPDQLQTLSKLTQVGIPLVGVVMMFGTFAMARRGKVYGAAWLLISVTWLLTLISTLPSGGINALGFGALVVILLAAGVLLGMRGVLFFFTLTLLSSVLLAEAEIAQWIPLVDHTLAPLPALIAYTALFSSSISMLYIATSDFQKANQKLNTTLKERLLYEQALRDQELSYRSLIEVAPDGIIIFDRDFRILYANARAHQVLNTGSQTDIGPEILKRIIHIVSQSNAIQKKLQSGLPVKIEEHIVMANDRDAWIEGSLKFIPDGGYQFIFEDISARKFVENGLRKRDEILEVVTIAAEQFLSSVDWRENINFVLERLGSGMNVSHAYLFEHTLSPENIPVTSLRYEWTAPGHVSDLGDPLFQNKPLLEPGFERSYQILSHGEVFLGDRSQFLTEEKEFLGNLGIKAIVDVPVFVERKWWGTLGFDDMVIDRIWQQAEIDALKVAANIISAAIQRQQADADRRASERNYRQTIESIGAVPYMLKYAEDRFEYIGESIFELTGYPADEITQSGWNNLIKETIVLGEAAGIDLREAVRLARTGKIKIWKCDYRIQTASGASRWVLDTAVEMLNDQGISTGSVGIFQDITDRKLIEAQTKQLNI